jgi:triacylglycerol lipase
MRRRPARASALLVAPLLLLLAQPSCDLGGNGPGYTQTHYPIVLCHGFLGFDSFFEGTAFEFDYWFDIVRNLEEGGAEVYVTEVSPVESSVNRGEQIIEQLDAIRALKGQPGLRFNLIGHSQGGIDVRYVAGVRPDLVASVTTVGSPHQGVDVYDLLVDAGGGLGQGLLDVLGASVDLLYEFLGNPSPSDAGAAFAFFDPANLAAFNADPAFAGGLPATPCGEGDAVTPTAFGPRRNYSWTGDNPYTNGLDPLDPVWLLTSSLYDEPNDGLVEVCSAHFGDVIRDDFRMNHLDEVNQLVGILALFTTQPTAVYRSHANRLKNEGL